MQDNEQRKVKREGKKSLTVERPATIEPFEEMLKSF
jgi:hypothetical protein